MARVVAQLLNGERLPSRPVDEPSSLSTYAVSATRDKRGRTVVYATETSWRHSTAFGAGIVAASEDPALVERTVRLLNKFDPAQRARRLFGWF